MMSARWSWILVVAVGCGGGASVLSDDAETVTEAVASYSNRPASSQSAEGQLR